MLVAPPLPSPPPTALPTPSTSRDARPILAGAGVATAKGVAVKENGARGFAVFQDGAGGETGERGNDWEDLGTNQSRKKENEIEAAVWKGETLHMPTTPKLGALRLEVFRDDVRFVSSFAARFRRWGADEEVDCRMYLRLRQLATLQPRPTSLSAPSAGRAKRRCSPRTRSRTTRTRT